VILAYSWRSMVSSMGKEHGQNRGPTVSTAMIFVRGSSLTSVWKPRLLIILMVCWLIRFCLDIYWFLFPHSGFLFY
jgi:hypothetical protein